MSEPYFIDRIRQTKRTEAQYHRYVAFYRRPVSIQGGLREMTYKGYEAVVEFDEDADIFTGEVINTRDVITFQGTCVDDLKRAFEDSVEDYLEFCASRNEEPEKPFSGNFVVRIPPALHRELALRARREGKSLNAVVIECLEYSNSEAVGAGR